ncbi:ArsR family transcriptional regulator [Alloyangia pacifica]|uniref:Helix-turn-helix domain-containing protein n=1 Tax=Alloyangia pacifica TaxID=311180 RepID=A0A1I6WBL5_9RHOB|nr:ArsR family transcriptional regulator [Alloyangia pacifica]SDI48138.1 Helix-turn-helix domain-containing protein [Alloyangia pacifica]SFT23370.1 Helix-turn-helix domain-containing protein [Alloyangia pacifica]
MCGRMDPVCLARLGLLGNPLRVSVLRLLVRYLPHPLAAGDLARALMVPPSTLSAHLAALCEAGLLVQRVRGSLRLYHAVPSALAQVIDWLGADVALGRAGADWQPAGRLRLLFLCADGARLSPLATALARRRLWGRARVRAAGVAPVAALDPVLVEVLAAHRLPACLPVALGVPFEVGAGKLDVVIALDERALAALPIAAQLPPPINAYWPLPEVRDGPVIPRAVALHAAMRALEPRLAALARLPLAAAPREAVQAALDSLSSGLPEVARAAGSAPEPRRRSTSPVLRASAAS